MTGSRVRLPDGVGRPFQVYVNGVEQAEDAGVLMPSGCRMGICYTCVLPLREGVVRDLRTGELTTAVPGETDRGGVLVQTCINAAAGPCHFDH